MGNTLSLPISSKVVGRKGDPHYRVAVADMQGFRLDFEDAHLVELEARKDKEGTSALFGVFDGHCGRVAADFLQANLLSYIQKAPDLSDKSLQQAMLNLDAEFCTDENRRHDGSTALFALARYKTDKSKKPEDHKSTTIDVTVANVGDCRCLLGRPDGTFEALTEDHKPSNPGERNRIVSAGGQVVMSRLDGQLALSRAVGDYSYKSNPSLIQTEQKLIALPDVTHCTAHPGDYLVLCCDGLFEKLSNQELMSFVHEALKSKENVDPADVVQALLDYSLESGSTDNMSAMIVQFRDGSGYSREDEFVAGPFYYGRHDNKFVDTYFQDATRCGFQPGSPQLLCLALDSDLKRNETRQKLIADSFETQLHTVRNTEQQIQQELSQNKLSAAEVARRLDLSKPQTQQYIASKTLRRTCNAQGSVVIATCTIPGVQHVQSAQAVAVVPNLAQDASSTFVALIDSQPRPNRLAERTQTQAVSANVRAQSDFLVQMLPQRINTLNNLSPAPTVAAKDKAGIQSAAVERSLQNMFSAINEDLLAHLTSQTISSASFNAETDAPGPSYVGFTLVSQLPSAPTASKALAKPLQFQVIAGNLGHAYVLHGKSTAEGEFGSLSSTFNPRSVSQMDRLEEAGMFSTNFEELATSFMGSNTLIRRFSAQAQKPFAHVLPHVAVAEAQEGDFIVICSHNLCASEDAPGDVDDMGLDTMAGTQPPSGPSFFRRERRPALEVQQKIARFVRDALYAARQAGTAPDAVQIAADLMDDLLPCRTNDLNASLVLILLNKEGTATQQPSAATASASDPSAMAVDDGPLVPIPATPSRNSEAKDLTTSMSFYAPPVAAPSHTQAVPRVDKFFRPGPIWEHRGDAAYLTQFLQHARDHAPELGVDEVIRRAYQADLRWLHSRQALVVKHREKELESLRAEHDAISALRAQEASRLPASQVSKTSSTASTVSVGSTASSPPADEAAQKKQKVHVKDT